MRIPEQLKSVGLKITGPRLMILSVFHDHHRRHLTADDIYRWARSHGTTLPFATIYRVLHQLAAAGVLTRAAVTGPAQYELPTERSSRSPRARTRLAVRPAR